jgi:hypothetical protein
MGNGESEIGNGETDVKGEPERDEREARNGEPAAAPGPAPACAPAAPVRSRLPGFGFLWLSAACLAVAAFLAWGLREPGLDRAGRVLLDLELGKKPRPSPRDLSLLRRTAARHPGLVPALLDGCPAALLTPNRDGWIETARAVLAVDPAAGADPVLTVESSAESATPRRILLAGRDRSETVEVPSAASPVPVRLSAALRAGGFLEVRAEGDEGAGGLADGFRLVPEGAARPSAPEADEER